MITVKSLLPQGRVALWDRHPDHPGGEVFIMNADQEYRVAQTDAVRNAISQGKLVKVVKSTPVESSEEPVPAGKKKGKSGNE